MPVALKIPCPFKIPNYFKREFCSLTEPLNRLLRQNTRSIGDRLMLILFSRVVFLNILIQKSAKLFGNVVPSQCHMVRTIHINRHLRSFERSWSQDTYICVTGLDRKSVV